MKYRSYNEGSLSPGPRLKSTVVARDPQETRRKLLDTAEQLFAARGIATVSLNEITSAAGQRNASALQYHFGSRDGLLSAILGRHIPALVERRRQLLVQARAIPDDARVAAEAFVRPLAEAAGRGGQRTGFPPDHRRAADRPGPDSQPGRGPGGRHGSAGRQRVTASSLRRPPPELRRERFRVAGTTMLHVLADRARSDETPHPDRLESDPELFIANLVDMYLAAVSTPPSPQTMALLASGLESVGAGPTERNRP